MEKILIAGASGFVGKNLSQFLLQKNYHVSGIGTSSTHSFSEKYENFDWICADTTVHGSWQKEIDRADVIINLTGKTIFRYWTKKYKQDIYNSRILTTRHIVDAMGSGKLLISASAVGYYGNCDETLLNEDALSGNDFLAHVCRDWEKEAFRAKEKDGRVAILRLGVVLGNGGALASMVPAFKMFVGGPLGNGKQWFPWVHIKDIEKAVEYIIRNKELNGPFNLVGSEPVRQKNFAQVLGKILNRPAFIPTPAFAVRMIMGEMGKSLLNSQKVAPSRLGSFGCDFLFNDIEEALKDIFEK